MMKRMTALFLSALLALGTMSACQQEKAAESVGVVNPLKSSSAEEIQELGYSFHLPESAEEVNYSIINISDSEKIAQVSFVVDHVEYNHRMIAANEMTDISGVYLQVEDSDTEVEYCPAKIAVGAEGDGKIYWYDVVPGLLYSLSMKEGATEELLLNMAEEIFVPAQGEVG